MHEDSSNEDNEEQIWKKAAIELHQKEIQQQELELINIKRQLELSTCCNTLSMGLLGQRNLPSLHYYDISMAYLQ